MNCLNCGNITPIWGNKNKKYCNTKCLREYENKVSKKIFTEIHCAECNTKFLPKNSTNKFCSRACNIKNYSIASSKKQAKKNCLSCNKEFNPYTSLDKFCSYNCRIENMKSKRKYKHTNQTCLNRSGDKNPNYVHGKRSMGVKVDSSGIRLFHKNRDELKNDIIEKDGFLYCQMCSKSNVKLETHHIIFRSEKPKHEFLHDKINLILVCVPCHNHFHNKKGSRNDLVEKRGLHNYFGVDVLYK